MIRDFDYNSLENSITFDNYSYVIDTPKNNDYVIFENANERVDYAEVVDGKIKLHMFPENPDHIKLYNEYTFTCNVVIYDPLSRQYIKIIKGIIVGDEESKKQSTVTITIDENPDDVIGLLNNKQYDVTVLNTTEYPIEYTKDGIEGLLGGLSCSVSYDYDTQ